MAGTAPPTADGYPLLGVAPHFLRHPMDIEHVSRHGDVVTYGLLHRTFTGVYHPDPIEQVLVTDAPTYRKSDLLRNSRVDFLENGVFLAEGETWRRQRTFLQPMFTLDRIESYGDAMVEHTDHVIDNWADGEVVDLQDTFSTLTLRILASTLLGVDLREDHEATVTRLTEAILAVSDPSNAAAFLPPWVPTPTLRRFERAVGEFEALVEDLVAERRGARAPARREGARNGRAAQPRADGVSSTADGTAAPDDLLGMMAAAEYEDGTRMSEETIRDQLMTFLLAGHETSALALTYAVYYLARDPETTAQIREEVESVGTPLSAADVADLDWTEWAIEEAMRLRPPAYLLMRQPEEPVTLGGYRIPEGRTLTLSPYAVQTDARWYDEPDAYRPSRRQGGLEDDLPDYAYFPFGGGPRHCIAMRFAMLELQLALATMLDRVAFDLVTDPADVGYSPGVTLRPDRPIEVRVSK